MKTIKVPTVAYCGLCGVAASSIYGLIHMRNVKKEKEELEDTLDFQIRKSESLETLLSDTRKAYYKLLDDIALSKEQG